MLMMMALCSAELLGASQEMNVALCNLGNVSDSTIAAAKAETELVYSSAGVRIVWRVCDDFPAPSAQLHNPWLIIRLLNTKPPRKVGAASLDVMGKAFVGDSTGGTMADAYDQAIQSFSEEHAIDRGVLLGLVIAHEIGHLLLGPGHTPDGVMQAAWGEKQTDAFRRRWLKFGRESAQRIRLALQARTEPNRE
jgi:hypothetical protein